MPGLQLVPCMERAAAHVPPAAGGADLQALPLAARGVLGRVAVLVLQPARGAGAGRLAAEAPRRAVEACFLPGLAPDQDVPVAARAALAGRALAHAVDHFRVGPLAARHSAPAWGADAETLHAGDDGIAVTAVRRAALALTRGAHAANAGRVALLAQGGACDAHGLLARRASSDKRLAVATRRGACRARRGAAAGLDVVAGGARGSIQSAGELRGQRVGEGGEISGRGDRARNRHGDARVYLAPAQLGRPCRREPHVTQSGAAQIAADPARDAGWLGGGPRLAAAVAGAGGEARRSHDREHPYRARPPLSSCAHGPPSTFVHPPSAVPAMSTCLSKFWQPAHATSAHCWRLPSCCAACGRPAWHTVMAR